MKNNRDFPKSHQFTYDEIVGILDKCYGKTLGELDAKNVFKKAEENRKITGIAGDVIEQSVLGYEQDNSQRPDIMIDNQPYEVKTTGIRYIDKKNVFEAKEPMSITAVSPQKIVNEVFQTSHFWEKLAHMLIVYYLYDSDTTVPAIEYANFPFKGYQFHQFNSADKAILKSDWEIVKGFIQDIQDSYDNPEDGYPRLSSELRDKLMYIDTAPKWPHHPRFRLKRSFVTSIVQNYFAGELETLPEEYSAFSEFDKKLKEITKKYKGLTVKELINSLGIAYEDENRLNKAIGEQIVIKMFGGKSKKINKIDLFSKVGIIAKTICLSSRGGRTEDMKLFPIDFGECKANLAYEETYIYDYFMNHQLLCIVFEEKDEHQQFKDNKFLGFKRVSFSDAFVENDVRKTWDEICDLVNNYKLAEKECYRKSGEVIVNKIGTKKVEINFPKSSNHNVFVRGAGKDSTDKSQVVNGIHMLRQWIWIKGKYIVSTLKEQEYI